MRTLLGTLSGFLLFTAACSARETHDAALACAYSDAGNPSACPPSYSISENCAPCPQVGLRCIYAGEGDGQHDGCFGAAELTCKARDAGFGGCAADGGASYWIATQ